MSGRRREEGGAVPGRGSDRGQCYELKGIVAPRGNGRLRLLITGQALQEEARAAEVAARSGRPDAQQGWRALRRVPARGKHPVVWVAEGGREDDIGTVGEVEVALPRGKRRLPLAEYVLGLAGREVELRARLVPYAFAGRRGERVEGAELRLETVVPTAPMLAVSQPAVPSALQALSPRSNEQLRC